ncbi:ricin-type beta-trefoil lectin domain protein [Streptomyces fuscigenes]|nr:ricin-type beta-trefoil lectin domain protein [Streptomyces fuscigenes]
MCLGAVGTGDQAPAGTAVELLHCSHSERLQWTMRADHTVRALGKCLDVVGAGLENNSKLQLSTCAGTDGERWAPTPDGSLQNPRSRRCLDDPAAATDIGTRVQIYDCNGLYTQHWSTPRIP